MLSNRQSKAYATGKHLNVSLYSFVFQQKKVIIAKTSLSSCLAIHYQMENETDVAINDYNDLLMRSTLCKIQFVKV